MLDPFGDCKTLTIAFTLLYLLTCLLNHSGVFATADDETTSTTDTTTTAPATTTTGRNCVYLLHNDTV